MTDRENTDLSISFDLYVDVCFNVKNVSTDRRQHFARLDEPDDSKERALRTVSVRLASKFVKKLRVATFDL